MVSLCVICLLLLSGCEQESIHTYLAPKAKPFELSPNADSAGMGETAIPVPTRMLGAILRQPDQTWFFKLTGAPGEAADLREKFGKFVASTRFENGVPSWEIPPDWTEERGRMMRFTTYHIGQNGPEVSISTLPNNTDETTMAVENINRWRNQQLGLSRLTTAEFQQALAADNDAEQILPEGEGEIVSISTPAGKAILVDFVGVMASGGGPPFANMGSPPQSPPTAPLIGPPPQSASGIPRLSPPDHWRSGETNTVALVAYEIGEGANSARVTLSSAFGSLLANVNRWRVNQLGLKEWTEEELTNAKQNLSGNGFTADYFKLVGPDQTILAAVIPRDGQLWFVKLMGPNELAEQEAQNFENLVKTMQF